MGIPYKSIFRILESWRKEILQDQTVEEPAINSLAFADSPNRPWAILVSTIISLRTKDEVTRVSSQKLLARAAQPGDLLKLRKSACEKLLYPAGFYRNKTETLYKIASIITKEYGGQVPHTLEDLINLPGVGKKTANLVLSEAFGVDAICVDIHVHRIANRMGWVLSARPDETEEQLRNTLPRIYWKSINPLLVLFGQQICRPLSPHCSRCPLSSPCLSRHCQKVGLGKTR